MPVGASSCGDVTTEKARDRDQVYFTDTVHVDFEVSEHSPFHISKSQLTRLRTACSAYRDICS